MQLTSEEVRRHDYGIDSVLVAVRSGIRFTFMDMTVVMGCGIVVVWLSIGRMVCRITINAIRHGTAIGQEP